jgi:hypothetical protein
MSLVTKRSDEIRRVLEGCKAYFLTAGAFSLAINILYLAQAFLDLEGGGIKPYTIHIIM